MSFESHQGPKLSMEAFDILRVLGKGNFGKVLLVKKKDSLRVYAIKALRKQHILDRGGSSIFS